VKKILVWFIFILINFISGQNYAFCHSWIENGDLDYLDRFIARLSQGANILESRSISIREITDLNKAELRLIRNMIYARHGYIFNSIDLQEHFSQFYWYSGVSTNIDNEITPDEWNAIEFIRRMENNYPSDAPNELIGMWYIRNADNDDKWGDPPWYYYHFAPGAGELYFFQNGTFFYNYYDNSADSSGAATFIQGFWSFSENMLNLEYIFIHYSYPYSHVIFNEFFDPEEHGKYYTFFNEHIVFYNRNTNWVGEEVWECIFFRNLRPWRKMISDPFYAIPG
jgi:hypothetical protein